MKLPQMRLSSKVDYPGTSTESHHGEKGVLAMSVSARELRNAMGKEQS